MKKKTLSLLAVIMQLGAFVTSAWAYDGSVVAPSGQTIYYNFNNTTSTITITVPGYTQYWEDYPKPTGALVIPDSITHNGINYPVTTIGYAAFRYCSGLTSVSLPSTVTLIGSDAFSNCTGLTTINIPDSVTSIEDDAFEYCSNLQSIIIPDAVTHIGIEAFQSCSSMISATIGNGVTSIGNYTFHGCTSLTNLTLGNSIITIGTHAFSNCSSLTSVTIPDNVVTLGSSAFIQCTALTSVSLGNGIHSINELSFAYTGLTSVMIPNNVTSIGEKAFRDCTHLTSVIIGDGVDTIEAWAFKNCTSLTSVTMGSGVNTILTYAFMDCSQISDIYMRGSIPPTLSINPFYGVPSTANLHVPCNATVAYQNAAIWNQFNIVEALPYILSAISVDTLFGTVEVTQAPTCSDSLAVVLAVANTGYHFTHWSNGSTDNPLTLTVDRDTFLTAYFAQDTLPTPPVPDTVWRTVTVTANVAGACETYGSGRYADSSTVEIGYIVPDTTTEGGHWQFLGWSDGPTETPRQILVTSDTAIVALFEWVADSVGIAEIENGEPGIVIYPNPTSGRVTIANTDYIVAATLTDIMGRREEVHLTPTGPGQYTLDLTHHPVWANNDSPLLLTLTTADGHQHTVKLQKQ
ncbi:MAG: leucine-rich repeat domain-containing protein [bacterium]